MLHFYNTLLIPVRPAALFWSFFRSRDRVWRREWAERRGVALPSASAGATWIHGSSAGEVRIVVSLVDALSAAAHRRPVVVSAFTPTGRAGLPEPPRVQSAFFVPLDLPAAVRRVLAALRPSVLGLVETELWPNLLTESRRSRIPVVVVNGRLSDRRIGRYRRFRRLYRPLLRGLHRVGAQSQRDAERFVELGVPEASVVVTGNIKYDLSPPHVDVEAVRARLGVVDPRAILVAGSTGDGEEAPVLDAFKQLRRRFPSLLLVLVPRHPRRADEVEAIVGAEGLRCRRWSRSPSGEAPDVVLVDTVGDLPRLFAVADVAFVGGSLVPVGGHNVLEPAAVGCPVLFGPHTENFDEPAELLVARGAGYRVRDAAELAARTAELLADDIARGRMGSLGEEAVRANRGALDRSVRLLVEAADLGDAARTGGS